MQDPPVTTIDRSRFIRDNIIAAFVAYTLGATLVLGGLSLVLTQFDVLGGSVTAPRTLLATAVVFVLGFVLGGVLWVTLYSMYVLDEAPEGYRDFLEVSSLYVSDFEQQTPYGIVPTALDATTLHVVHDSIEGFNPQEQQILKDYIMEIAVVSKRIGALRGVLFGIAGVLFVLSAVNTVVLPVALIYVVVLPMLFARLRNRIKRRVHRAMYRRYGKAYVRYLVRRNMPTPTDVSTPLKILKTLYIGPSAMDRIVWLDEDEIESIIEEEHPSKRA